MPDLKGCNLIKVLIVYATDHATTQKMASAIADKIPSIIALLHTL
ncbi:MAG: flavodoxin family protein [Tolypothrix sp. Co-bin9]|nr:flavodoxin family protein [Tolypothrix sp. Co-bin9]